MAEILLANRLHHFGNVWGTCHIFQANTTEEIASGLAEHHISEGQTALFDHTCVLCFWERLVVESIEICLLAFNSFCWKPMLSLLMAN